MIGADEIESIEIGLVLEAIREKYGYDLRRYEPSSMHRRIRAAFTKSGAAHLGEFQHRLLTDEQFFTSVFNDLTVQVSEMFRDPSFYRSLREEVVPLLRTYPQLKVWHAGCAGGEEVYATAILLREEGLYDRTVIYATDVSVDALERAREGVYSDAQAALFADNHARSGGRSRFEDYFSRAYGHAAVQEPVRRNIVFFQHDLASDYALGEMHVIFCRNVLIYFGADLRARVLGMFGESLVHGGFLGLGASERLSGRALDSFVDYSATERIYRRRDAP